MTFALILPVLILIYVFRVPMARAIKRGYVRRRDMVASWLWKQLKTLLRLAWNLIGGLAWS